MPLDIVIDNFGLSLASPQIQAWIDDQREYERIVHDIRNVIGVSETRIRAVASTKLYGIMQLKALVLRGDPLVFQELTA